MTEKKSGEAYRNIRVCVDSYDDGVPVGQLQYPGAERSAVAFHSLSQLLLEADRMLDEAQFPQSFTIRRTFVPVADSAWDKTPGTTAQKGALATFAVRILFRQHASWQGSVTWLEGKSEEPFRSVLELIYLMDSAMCGAS